jgi:hypothetical protein
MTTVRYAPYVPLRGVKVNSQLGASKEDELLRQAVTCLGGSMVGIQHAVSYYVARSGSSYGDFSVSEALEDFIGKHTNIYDSLILPEDMFERLNELMSRTLPVHENTITFRQVVYPIRASNYTELGHSLNFYIAGIIGTHGLDADETLEPTPVIDIVALKYKKNERDVWQTTALKRYQICKLVKSTFYIVGCFYADLFRAVHHTEALGSELIGNKSKYTFDTLDAAKACLAADYLQPSLKVDCDHVAPNLKVKDETDHFVEVLDVWRQTFE